MKTISLFFRALTFGTLLAILGGSISCVTTYDAAGRPVQTVDPVVASAGIAAAGLIGYAIAQDNSRSHYHGGYGYYRPPRYYGPPPCY